MTQKDETESLAYLLAHGDVTACDYRDAELPTELTEKQQGSVTVLLRDSTTYNNYGAQVVARKLVSLSTIRSQSADVCLLDHSALRSLVVRFPRGARYVLVRAAFRWNWFVALPGLIRRLYRKEVHWGGLCGLHTARGTKYWFVLRAQRVTPGDYRFGLSHNVGIQGFLDFLRREKINYVVLRFYRKLPHLNHPGGDLDILTADEDLEKVQQFLREHAGNIPIELRSTTSLWGSRAKISYFPPPLARQILANAVDGPAGSRIPAPKEAFLGFAFHVLYRKGLVTGVPTTLPDLESISEPENDYTGELRTMAQELGLEIDITMEALDDYLAQEGWRPKIDTLAKIAATNEWVWHRFFLQKSEEEIGLNVLILKRRAVEKGMMDTIIKMVEHEEFVVVRKKIFSEGEVPQVAGHLRGGDWKTGSDGTDAFLPAAVLVILDAHIVKLRGLGVQMHGDFDSRIRTLKNKLRKNFSDPSGNLIHSTDNTQQSWEYVEVCFPEAFQEVQQEIASYGDSSPEQSFFGRAISRLRLFPRYAKIQLRNAIFKRIMK